jgi:hypothetical protein
MYGNPLEYYNRLRDIFGEMPLDRAQDAANAVQDWLRGGGHLGGAWEDAARRIAAGEVVPRNAFTADLFRDQTAVSRELLGRTTQIDKNMSNVLDRATEAIDILNRMKDIIPYTRGEVKEEKEVKAAGGVDLGDEGNEILQAILNYAGVSAKNQQTIRNIIDTNSDGVISGGEVKDMFANDSAINKLATLSPALARMIREPDFRMRTIQKIDEPTILGTNPADAFSQVSLVQQGYANYDLAANMFNVNF